MGTRRNHDDRELIAEALRLPPEARAALAGKLIESLEGPVDADAEIAWALEIERRIHELDQSVVRAVPWSQARRMILGAG